MLLRSVDYGDTHRVVTLLTEDFGKIAALARGARRSRKRFGGALQPGVVMRAAIRFGRGELASLDRVEVESVYLNMLKVLRRIQLMGEGLTLVRDLCPDAQPDSELFAVTVEFLTTLDKTAFVEESAAAFEAMLLSHLGFFPRIDACSICGKEPADGQSALFDPSQSSIMCRRCGGGTLRLSSSARSRLRAASKRSWQPDTSWSEEDLGQVRGVLTAVIQDVLGRARSRSTPAPSQDQAERPTR